MASRVGPTAKELKQTVIEARDWLLALSEQQVRHKPTADRWSIAEVIGHLIDSACNNHQRFIRAQQQDTLTFPKYDQNFWTSRNHYHESGWPLIVELWYLYNLHLAGVIRNIPDDQLQTRCVITPLEPCTLEFLVVDYLDHLKHHLGKIRERITG